MQAIETRIHSDTQSMETRLKNYTDEQIREVKLLIENDVGKRLDSLFDGYQTVHEAHGEPENAWNSMKTGWNIWKYGRKYGRSRDLR